MPELLLPLAVLPFPMIDPVIVQIGPVAIHWYGLAYVVGILGGWWYAKRIAATERLWLPGRPAMAPEAFDDLLIWAAIGIVVGGRLGYVLFYDFAKYAANPSEILAVWSGGMSFHGGLIGCALAQIVFARRRGIRILSMFDVVGAVSPIAFFLVRCTNFINSELWGRPSDVPWAFVFPNGGPEPRHPSQLYEAGLEGVALFAVLWLLVWRGGWLARPGFVTGAFVAGYGVSRIFVEFFRVPDEQLGYLAGGWLTMGMVLSLPMVVAGLYLMARAKPVQPAVA
ncbi:MAG: prolipoprotein diacylglyceryl transferase [Rhizobiaceae bacterium]|nr:prolipoprotein diacylglyceryl transferase [Rhizobiaceae bacterium]